MEIIAHRGSTTDDIKENTLKSRSDSNELTSIRRTKDNQRNRPNDKGRQNPLGFDQHGRINSMIFIDSMDLEWLSLNWRTYRAQTLSVSNRRMILKMFDNDYQYFPTLREIRDSLIKAQMRVLEDDAFKWESST